MSLRKSNYGNHTILLMNWPLSIENITFLKDIKLSIKIDTRSEWRLHCCQALILAEIYRFLTLLSNNDSYLIQPLIVSSCSGTSIRLSGAFLVNNKSNSVLITNFIVDQLEKSGFDLNSKAMHTFAFNYKKVCIYIHKNLIPSKMT